MKYYSLNKQSPVVDFRSASIHGQAPDGGLYFPESIPAISKDLLRNIEALNETEIAFRVIKPFVGDTIDEATLSDIVSQTVSFPVPLVKLNPSVYSLELFHGPTLAFKDVGARFMSRCLGYFMKGADKKMTILVATSGDTGGAVANGFYGVEGVEVIILYPSGKVSPVQEKQLTTNGGNITALEVNGTFDDCQQMVKKAFTDADIIKRIVLTSANSINVARWLPQQFYYFFAYKQWPDKENPPVISVPSGNLGNICAGMMAMKTGLPVAHFIAACNENDIVSHYLQTGLIKPKQTIQTFSNAMDVGNPSNFSRILEIFGNDNISIKEKLSSCKISDKETLDAIHELKADYGYLPDPHGAVGFEALKRWLTSHPGKKGIFLETAHPVKFPDIVEKATGNKIGIPTALQSVMGKDKHSIFIQPLFEELKSFLLNR